MALQLWQGPESDEEKSSGVVGLEGPVTQIRLVSGLAGKVLHTLRIHDGLLSESLDRKKDKKANESYVEVYFRLGKDVKVYLSWLYTQRLPITPKKPISWAQLLNWSQMGFLFRDREFIRHVYQKATERVLQLDDIREIRTAYGELRKQVIKAKHTSQGVAMMNFMVDFYLIHRATMKWWPLNEGIREAIIDRLMQMRDERDSIIDLDRYDTIKMQEEYDLEARVCKTTRELITFLNEDIQRMKVQKEPASGITEDWFSD